MFNQNISGLFSLYVKRHMTYTTLTPDWILMNLTTGHTCDVNNNASVLSIDRSYHPFICESIISSFNYNFVSNELGDIQIQYFFGLIDIQDRCPNLYAELLALKP